MKSLREATLKLNKLMQNITQETVKEAHNIINKTYSLASSNLPIYTYEKCMLKLLSKEWNTDLFLLLKKHVENIKEINEESANIYIPYCILKYKQYREKDERYEEFIEKCDAKYKEKIIVCYKKQTKCLCKKNKSINREENSMKYGKLNDQFITGTEENSDLKTNNMESSSINQSDASSTIQTNASSTTNSFNTSVPITSSTINQSDASSTIQTNASSTANQFNTSVPIISSTINQTNTLSTIQTNTSVPITSSFLNSEKFKNDLFCNTKEICNFKKSHLFVPESKFYSYYNKGIICNYKKDLFSKMIHKFLDRKYSECKDLIRILVKKEYDKLHLYNILIFCYIQMGMFQEGIYYLDKCIEMSKEKVKWYFINYKLAFERMGNLQGPNSYLKEIEIYDCISQIDGNIKQVEGDIKQIKGDIKQIKDLMSRLDITNTKLEHNIKFENSLEFYREIRNIENNINNKQANTHEQKNLIEKQGESNAHEQSDVKNIHEQINLKDTHEVYSLYISNDILYISKIKSGSYEVYNTNINFTEISREYNWILLKNKDILKNETNKEIWWKERILLDKKMKILLNKIKAPDLEIKGQIFLILDEKLEEFPIEHTLLFEKASCYRLLSIEYLQDLTSISQIDLSSSIFLLDPKLSNTFDRITEHFKDIKKEIIEDDNKMKGDFICYFGHGNGLKYIDENIKSSVLFLFGCSSVRFLCINNFKKNGTIKKYIKNNRNVLGCLYEVTDKDLDMFSINLLSKNGDVSELIKECKDKMRLKYLNGCSLIVYGKPLHLQAKRA
ncbi:separin (ESP1) [Vairimorpha necatrix]|uniref:separase n=1 Tax=Vairimorpha necatrix TaxID=6039 RepID=A0AAX4JAX9_9MICR